MFLYKCNFIEKKNIDFSKVNSFKLTAEQKNLIIDAKCIVVDVAAVTVVQVSLLSGISS